MNIKYRKYIYRIQPLYFLIKYIVNIVNQMFFYFCIENHSELLYEMRENRIKDHCYIIGNGPSLCEEDLDALIYEDCFAMNKIYSIYNKTRWRPKYYIVQDRYAFTGEIFNTIEAKYKFVSAYYYRKNLNRRLLNKNNVNTYVLNTKRIIDEKNIMFSSEMDKYVYDTGTVTYTAIQIAVSLGYKKIFLLGIDNNYSKVQCKNGEICTVDNRTSHFYDDGKEVIIANQSLINSCYKHISKKQINLGIEVINMSRTNNIPWFISKPFEVENI